MLTILVQTLVMMLVCPVLHRQKQDAFAAACLSTCCCFVYTSCVHSKLEGF